MDFDTSVKMHIYQTIAETAHTPTAAVVAQSMEVSVAEVLAAFDRLHQKRLLVPEPGEPGRIRMASPFSGVATPFRVLALGRTYYANCVWDSLGVPAALHADAVVEASDGFSGEPITLEVRGGQPVPQECISHFAVPAARWWQDIIYT